MISGRFGNRIHIHITTYDSLKRSRRQNEDMAYTKVNKTNNHNKFICSICLNTRADTYNVQEHNEKKSKSCPVCHRTCDFCQSQDNGIQEVHTDKYNKQNRRKDVRKQCNGDRNSKSVQTSPNDFAEGLSLLNEVLQVFRDKREISANNYSEERNVKTVPRKDACVSTTSPPKLTISKVCSISIDDKDSQNNTDRCKVSIVNCYQPKKVHISQNSMDLSKRKSSSIPQMKLEELKHALKEKTKSKDAIEEVNRMFATVRKNDDRDSFDSTNRPRIRSGPRLLPVVKPKVSNSVFGKELIYSDPSNCCRNSNMLSSGDASPKVSEICCEHKDEKSLDKCEKCVYTLCHRDLNKHRSVKKTNKHEDIKSVVCERCKSIIRENKYRSHCYVDESGDTTSVSFDK